MQWYGRDKFKLLFVINSLEGGGAEKVLVRILNQINNEIFLCDVALLRKKGIYINELKDNVNIYDLGVRSEKIGKYIPVATKNLIDLEKKYDLVISFMWESNIINLIASLFSPKKRIISEHTNLIEYINITFPNLKRYFAVLMTKLFYRRANLIITPSHGVKNQLVSFCKIKDKNIKVIHNPFDLDGIKALSEEKIDIKYPYILFVGRLHKQKNIPLLLEAFKDLGEENLKLLIIGEGQEKEKLINLTNELDISERVVFMNFQKNPYKYMKKAICLVLPSYYEAFPNILVEAMASGCPVISTNCPFGPSEIIENEKNGILVSVDDIKGLTEALTRIISDENLRNRMIKNGYKIAEKCDIRKIIKQYEEAIREVLG